MASITECLAENIRQLRKERGITQAELAEKANISLVFLQGIESERKWISPATAACIARALKVSQARLFHNCFEDTPYVPRRKNVNLDHIPNDIFNALVTTCRHSEWQWQVFRWILQGYSKQIGE